ncbi:hypothetical protein TNCT_537251 [Trichonephila clavata]|uniref:Uncharacterized protein n=1 Tax=Trichonephila clavata TaxID=2740835 RepID=A0A8X6G004_TRICU|nr:hypothetical protein TNCT_537251 [Trichonephila clavata]
MAAEFAFDYSAREKVKSHLGFVNGRGMQLVGRRHLSSVIDDRRRKEGNYRRCQPQHEHLLGLIVFPFSRTEADIFCINRFA